MKNDSSDDLKTVLHAAISQGNLNTIEIIQPYVKCLEPADKYIPTELVIKSGTQYKKCVDLLLEYDFTIDLNSCSKEYVVSEIVKNGDLRIISQLLNHGVNVNIVNSNTGFNLLATACLYKHHQIVENLLQHGADVNATITADWKANNELNFVSSISKLNHFLSLVKVDYQLSDITCLHIAVLNNDPITAEILLKNHAKIKEDPEFCYITCLAAQLNYQEIIRIFLDYGLRVKLINLPGEILLHSCIYFNSYEKDFSYDVIRLLLKQGINHHLFTPRNTFLYDAMKNEHHKTAALFLDYEADVQYIGPNGDTILHMALRSCYNLDFIINLLKLKPPVNVINNKKLTPLMVVCKKNINFNDHFKIIETFLKYNANVNCTDSSLQTPLHLSCGAYESEVMHRKEYLDSFLTYNADIEAVDADGWTPLLAACYSQNAKAVNILLDKHAYVNHTDLQNLTALHIAVEKGSGNEIAKLIKFGADISILDNYRQTALQIAVEVDKALQTSLFCGFETLSILKEQVVKLVVVGMKVNDEDRRIAYDSDAVAINISDLTKSCQQEVERMKTEIISFPDMTENITFYDLLKKDVNFLRTIVYNDAIRKKIQLKIYDEKFPLYIDIVRGRFRDIQVRYETTDSARKYFLEYIYQQMPDNCLDTIFSYLTVGEMRMFITTFKQLNN